MKIQFTLDAYAASHRAVKDLKDSGQLPKRVQAPTSEYLSHIIEQDHRRVRQRLRPMLGLKSLQTTRAECRAFANVRASPRRLSGSYPAAAAERAVGKAQTEMRHCLGIVNAAVAYPLQRRVQTRRLKKDDLVCLSYVLSLPVNTPPSYIGYVPGKDLPISEFPQQLAALRKQHGLTQQQLAERIGIHVVQLRRTKRDLLSPRSMSSARSRRLCR